MANISEDRDFTDFTLESEDGVKFLVHGILFAAQSSVLKRMLLSPFEERENNKKPIVSPMFTMAGKKLAIKVFPGGYPFPDNYEEFISVFLSNRSKESITVTANFKADGKNRTNKNTEFNVGRRGECQSNGFNNFLSHGEFRKWAKENKDVFSLEMTMTLHIKGANDWTTER